MEIAGATHEGLKFFIPFTWIYGNFRTIFFRIIFSKVSEESQYWLKCKHSHNIGQSWFHSVALLIGIAYYIRILIDWLLDY